MKQTKILETGFERKRFKLTTTNRKKENLQQGGRNYVKQIFKQSSST